MEAVHTEIHECTEKGFGKIFREVIKQKKVTNLLYGKKTNWGNKLEAMRQRGPKTMPELIPYQQKIEDCKETLFSVDAGLTQTIGAIAETGSLILKPDEQEPRLLSLVPPIHLAVLDSKRIYSTFSEAIREEGWSRPMPSNVLLISGPSKTADIEQTLVYGIHGPKQLILFLIR